MADHVIIKKDGLWAAHWNSDKKDHDWERVEEDTVLTHLRTTCTVEDGVTISDIFKMVERLPVLEAFMAQYSWCPAIQDFHTEARMARLKQPLGERIFPKLFKPEGEESPLKYATIMHRGEARSFKGESSIEIYDDFSGVGPPEKGMKEADEGIEEIKYGISYCPMSDLAHLPLKLDKELKITMWTKDGLDIIFEGDKEFTLLEVLDAIYWDISFRGGPRENAEFIRQCKSQVETIKEDIEKHGGVENLPKDKYKTWEELDQQSDL